MEIIKINTPFIKLQQLLKYADVVSDGTDARILIVDRFVSVNGEVEVRRGRKIYPDDEILISYDNQNICLKVMSE